MQSYYNVIKSGSVIKQGNKQIVTNAAAVPLKENLSHNEDNARVYIDSYENLAKNLIENARRQSEQILSKAYEEAQSIEAEAQNRGYQNGFEQGYRDAEEKFIRETYEPALEQANEIIENAENTLRSAKEEYESYLKAKEQDIKELVVAVAESLLKKEVREADSLNSMILDALNQEKNAKSFVIRCNNLYISEVKKNIPVWKEQLALNADIFVVEDNSIEQGNVVMDKENGKIMVGIEQGIQRIREVLEGND